MVKRRKRERKRALVENLLHFVHVCFFTVCTEFPNTAMKLQESPIPWLAGCNNRPTIYTHSAVLGYSITSPLPCVLSGCYGHSAMVTALHSTTKCFTSRYMYTVHVHVCTLSGCYGYPSLFDCPVFLLLHVLHKGPSMPDNSPVIHEG